MQNIEIKLRKYERKLSNILFSILVLTSWLINLYFLVIKDSYGNWLLYTMMIISLCLLIAVILEQVFGNMFRYEDQRMIITNEGIIRNARFKNQRIIKFEDINSISLKYSWGDKLYIKTNNRLFPIILTNRYVLDVVNVYKLLIKHSPNYVKFRVENLYPKAQREWQYGERDYENEI